MNISASQMRGNVPVVILNLDGQLDGQSYQELIAKVQELFNAGERNFLLDLRDLTYMSSAGLVALHSVALLTRGETLPNLESGWPVYRSLGRSSEAGIQKHVKLLNPRPEVMSVLDMVGFASLFAIFSNLEEAVNSFA
jgi:anti-anti-sigma regulatory factor